MSNEPKFHLPANLWAKLPKLVRELFGAMQTHIEELEARKRELKVRGWARTRRTPCGLPLLTLQAFSAPKGQVHQIGASEEYSQGIWAITASNTPQMRLIRNLLTFLVEACQGALSGSSPPSLVQSYVPD